MATKVVTDQALLGAPPTCPVETPAISFFSSNSTTFSVNLNVQAPFPAIKALFDHLHAHPEDVEDLNATYPRRGVMKTAALHKTQSDQKFTIDLSPMRNSRIPDTLRDRLSPHGFNDVLHFFETLAAQYIPTILSSLSISPVPTCPQRNFLQHELSPLRLPS